MKLHFLEADNDPDLWNTKNRALNDSIVFA